MTLSDTGTRAFEQTGGPASGALPSARAPDRVRIGPDASSVLIVVDVQNSFMPGGSLPVERGDEIVPIGVAATRREGSDITLLTYGAMVTPSLEAADALSKEDVEVEVIDLRTLLPFDRQAILASVEKTSRALIVHEDVKTLGLGAELSAVIMEERFEHLDAPVMRVTYPDTHVPFSQVLEQANLPNVQRITDALRRLAEY